MDSFDHHCTSRIARKWLETNSVEVLEWSVQSPDLNPIKYLWQHSKKKIDRARDGVSQHPRAVVEDGDGMGTNSKGLLH